MKKMRVVMYYNNRDVRIEDMPIPEINENELLIKVQACGICGSDVMEWYRIKKAPLVLGHEMTGDIVKIGKNVKNVHVGERVFVSHHVPCNTCKYCLDDQHTLCDTLHSTNFYPGGFAEYLKVPEINVDKGVFPLPLEVSYEEGVFIEPLACVVRGVRISGFKPGKSVVIIGSGISGLLHVKLIRAYGAGRIITTDVNDYRLQFAKKIGSDHIINAKKNVPKEIKKCNDGELADYVFLCTSAISAITQAINSLSCGGTLILFAPIEPDINVPFPLFELWNKGVKIISTYAGSPKDIRDAITLLRFKRVVVKDMITHKLSLSEASKGFQLVMNAGESMKVIIYPQK